MTTQIQLDQSCGDLTLHTGRAGLGSRVGHDLTLRVGRWSAQATVDGQRLTGLRLVAALSSLEVVRGDGGLKPLSDKDKQTILSSAATALRASTCPEVVFEATDLQVDEGQSTVTGRLSLAGAVEPQAVQMHLTRDRDRVRVQGHAEVVQSAYGIAPYSGMLGALKVRDAVEIRAELSVTAP